MWKLKVREKHSIFKKVFSFFPRDKTKFQVGGDERLSSSYEIISKLLENVRWVIFVFLAEPTNLGMIMIQQQLQKIEVK